MKKFLKWIEKVVVFVLSMILGIIILILEKIWKLIVGYSTLVLLTSIIITLFIILDGYLASHISDYELSGINMWSEMLSFENLESAMASIMVICFMWVIPIVVLIVNWGYKTRCPACKKWFSIKENGKELIKSENIQILAEVKTKNNLGDVIGTQEQYIPGTRKTYRRNYICRRCGAVKFETYSKDTKNT